MAPGESKFDTPGLKVHISVIRLSLGHLLAITNNTVLHPQMLLREYLPQTGQRG